MTGPLITAGSTTLGAGTNVAPGVAPTSPNNGDLWVTALGIYIRVNGVTVGPLASTTSTVAQEINLNSSPLQAPLTGTILQMGNANGVISRANSIPTRASGSSVAYARTGRRPYRPRCRLMMRSAH